jgi:hypothetical protein
LSAAIHRRFLFVLRAKASRAEHAAKNKEKESGEV